MMEYDWMHSKKRPRKPRKIETEWLPSDVKMLIHLVEQRDLLWDPSKSTHKDSKMREKTFQIIAEALNRTLQDCKTKWDNLRAQYRSYQAKAKQNISVKWQYFELLSFLDNVCEPRKSKSNLTNLDACISNDPISIKTSFSLHQDQFGEDMETRSSFFHSPKRKIIKDDEHSDPQFNDDSTMMDKTRVSQEQNYNSAQIFGDFVADQMRQLNPHIADDLKKKILKLVLDALEKNNN